MKVAMVVPRYPPNIHGGGEISCKLLVDTLRKKDVDVEVFSFDRVFPHIWSKLYLNYKAVGYLKDKVDDFDVFHTYNMDLLPAVGRLTKKFGINSVATLNGIVFSPSMSTYRFKYLSPKFYRNLICFNSIKNISCFTTLFQVFKDKWVEDGLDKDKITVIPNMLDPSFKPEKRKKSEDEIRLLHVGNFSPTRKEEIETLIKSYSKLKKQDVSLKMVGKGKEKVEALVERYKPKNSVNHLGEKDYEELPSIYADSDIFVHPSSLPKTADRVIYEAMLSGVCVVTTGNDYYSQVIRNKKDGLLLYPMNSEKLAENIQMLIDNPELRKKMAESGKKRVQNVCNPNRVTDRYIRVYEDLIK
ncbi:MAG: glycosyltransferase family 4 protein [Candidatus Thermoplasmatota archaeon]